MHNRASAWRARRAQRAAAVAMQDTAAPAPVSLARATLEQRLAEFPAKVGELRQFLGALQRFSPDVVLDLMGNHKAGAISALTFSDRRIGAARPWRREPSSA